ncbi:MAG: DUF1566 domain-containing protein [Halomonas sp.]|nr:DUF1566 domain-containing protein [Halomonas sp.]MCC5884541.1 DUF1566 domain-containing protein [Halomonas sp.]
MRRRPVAVAAGLWLATCGVVLGDATAAYDTSQAGLVVDGNKQLVWMRCSLGQHYQDGRCLGEAERFNWSEAQAHVETLASAACPWRLPRFHEMRGLMQPSDDASGEASMAIDLEVFSDTPAGWFWNQASAGGHSQQDCFVDFSGEGRTRCNMGGQFYLRPVMTQQTAVHSCQIP